VAAHPQAVPIRVLVADDHPLFVQALEAILTTDPRVQVVGTARDGREAVDLALALMPDVVLMDISMPVLDGIEAARELRDSNRPICVLMLTGSSSSADVDRAREAGAAGYVTKDRIALELIETIVDVAARLS
jgi:two-component system, NarL family, nitrate/nitrite response regulator NarL